MSDLTVIKSELAPVEVDAKKAIDLLKGLPVNSAESLDFAGQLTKDVKRQREALDNRRKELVGPMTSTVSSINSLFRPVIRYLDEQEDILKAKISEYTSAQLQAQRDAMHASAAEYQAGGIPTAIVPATPQTEGVSVKEEWSFEFLEPHLVPREYLSPDPVKVRIARDMWLRNPNAEPPPIPGVRFFIHGKVTVRK